jgi:hypothetical protein
MVKNPRVLCCGKERLDPDSCHGVAASTILTYVLLCVYSTASLQRVRFGERYGEVLSGVFVRCSSRLSAWHSGCFPFCRTPFADTACVICVHDALH